MDRNNNSGNVSYNFEKGTSVSSTISGIGSRPQVISGASKAAPRQPQREVNISNENDTVDVNASKSLESVLKSLNEALDKKSSAPSQKNGMKLDQYA